MSTKYTRKDAEKAVRRLAEALNLPYGHYVVIDDEPQAFDGERAKGRFKHLGNGGWFTTQPDALELDYNPTYGGCVIHQIAPDGGTWIK